MTATRIIVPAVKWHDEDGNTRISVPLRCSDGTWSVLDDEGTSHYRDSDEVRQFAADCLREDCPGFAAALTELADIIDGITIAHARYGELF